MVLVIYETTGSDPAVTKELTYRLIAKNGIIWELLNRLHERPFSASLSLLTIFSFWGDGPLYPICTGFCNEAF